MKKFIALFLSIIFVTASSIVGYAGTGKIIGNVYSTDILAAVNGIPIPSYSIDGKTVILVEDLRYYGFDVIYDNESRSLNVSFTTTSGNGLPTARGQLGTVVGNIYKTDIIINFGQITIPGFAIDGKMCVAIEDLGDLIPGLSHRWDGVNRVIALYVQNALRGVSDITNNETTLRFFFGAERLLPEYESFHEYIDMSFPAGSVSRIEEAFEIGFKNVTFSDEIKYWSIYPESFIKHIIIDDRQLFIDFTGERPTYHSGGSESYEITKCIAVTMFLNYDVDVVNITYDGDALGIGSNSMTRDGVSYYILFAEGD